MVEKAELVAVYSALIKIAEKKKDCSVSEISERANKSKQKTEIALDELEHMGFAEVKDGYWHPKV